MNNITDHTSGYTNSLFTTGEDGYVMDSVFYVRGTAYHKSDLLTDEYIGLLVEDTSMSLTYLATKIARQAHAGQLHGDEDYYEGHVRRVLETAVSYVKPEFTCMWLLEIVAILHDVAEDAPELRELVELYNPLVVECVNALTKDKSLCRNDQLGESLARIMATHPIAAHVKLADRLVNISKPFPAKWSRSARSRYLQDAVLIAVELKYASTELSDEILKTVLMRYEDERNY